MRRMLAFSCVAGLACAALSGCAHGEVRQVIRAQFASELSCPEVSIRKRDAWYMYESPDQYKVSGCGVIRTYTCPAGDGLVSYDEPACTWVAGDADAPQMAKVDEGDADGAPAEDGAEPPADDAAPIDADAELDAAESPPASEPEPPAKKPEKPAAAEGKSSLKAGGGLKLGGGAKKKK